MAIAKVAGQTIGALSWIGRATAPVDTYTKLLIFFDGADAATSYTAETGQTVTFAGTAQLDTAEQKFGASSLLLDGNSDYVTIPDSTDWDYGSGDFTIDFWIKFNVLQDTCIMEQGGVSTNDRQNISYSNTNHTIGFAHKAISISEANYKWPFTPEVDTWYHIAIERISTSMVAYLNGSLLSATELTAIGSTTLSPLTDELTLGRREQLNDSYLDGWLDEFRISKGRARWTSAFIPPPMAYGKTNKVAGITV